ncbi:hypothetical protein GCM10023149_24520 [Mucilaginibacter gynuensis]|uniref:Uncharacterized protein n=1 Tax=Mucilaginibacter gynuensis TaxID=1302236 RepID=A0ABP8GFN4_9SPHI
METLNMDISNVTPILKNLATKIKLSTPTSNTYLRRYRKNEAPFIAGVNALGVNEAPLPEILIMLGIRSMTLNTSVNLEALSNLKVTTPAGENEQHQWVYFKDETVLTALRELFQNCKTIAFDDWAGMWGASDLWYGLLRDVIMPTGKIDIEFIFYLGDALNKLFFEVDEALDVIGDFSRHGNVTFALDQKEAVKLWMMLNGVKNQDTLPEQSSIDLKRKYFSIFRTMNIARLMIYSANDVSMFSNEKQFVLSRRTVDAKIEYGPDARQDYIAGLSTGFLFDMDIAYCITLGLIAFGTAGALGTEPQRNDLLSYIDTWLADLDKPSTIDLYQ